ncbi:DMT family transporter [Roseovarius sp. EL26]|uniref:DMT family transporter n=1 Tax=Roseovarius sp. EL26 TaxID=2126672 RepID=UPI000EA30867|nr:DMT family transporter [Roseovarius sp. EL26]
MTSISPSTYTAPSRSVQGIIAVELGMVVFVFQDAMMKTMLDLHPIWFLIFMRAVVAVSLLIPLIVILGKPHRLFTPLWPLHLLRAFLFASGFSMFYAAFPFMGLAEVTTIFFSAPLITALMAALFLKEQIGPHRIGALIVGFIGILIAMNPFGGDFSWIAILPLGCAVTYAASQVLARKIGERESSLTVGLYTLAISGILILPMGWGMNQIFAFGPEYSHLQWSFGIKDTHDLLLLVVLGLLGTVGWILLSRAYQIANPSLVATFDYTYLPFATILAYFMWDEVPPTATFIGMSIIIASGLYVGLREIRAARGSKEQPFVAETTYAPGNPLTAYNAYDDDLR